MFSAIWKFIVIVGSLWVDFDPPVRYIVVSLVPNSTTAVNATVPTAASNVTLMAGPTNATIVTTTVAMRIDTTETPHSNFVPENESKTSNLACEINGLSGAVPWAGTTYLIKDKTTGKVITRVDGDLVLQEHFANNNHHAAQWLCGEKRNFFYFYHPYSETYMGHYDGDQMFSEASSPHELEFFITKLHPGGGYQILSPFCDYELRAVVVASNGIDIVRKDNASTLWEFVEVLRGEGDDVGRPRQERTTMWKRWFW